MAAGESSLEQLIANMPFALTLGIELRSASAGEVPVAFASQTTHSRGRRIVQ
jgi:hypothetical protein